MAQAGTGGGRPDRASAGRARRWAFAAALASALFAACAGPPVESYRPFATAARDARTGGHLIYDRVAPFIPAPAAPASTARAATNCVYASLEVDCAFDPAALATTGAAQAGPPELAVRRVLLDMVTAYAVLLAELAEGSGTARAEAGRDELAELARTAAALAVLIPPAAAIAPVLGAARPLIERLEQARAQAARRATLVADRPVVQSVLRGLGDDTAVLYRIYGIGRYRAFNRAQAAATSREDAQARKAAAKADIEQYRAALAAYVRTLQAMSSALDVLAASAEAGGRPNRATLAKGVDQAVSLSVEARRLLDAARGAGAAAR
jgi:hypothetical protein